MERYLKCGAKTPANRVKCTGERGTIAANRSSRSGFTGARLRGIAQPKIVGTG